jgi:carnitine O-acetyltransferase
VRPRFICAHSPQKMAQEAATLRDTTTAAAAAAGVFCNQAKLPRLPIPTLEESVGRYLEWVRPLVDDEAYVEAAAWAEEFISDPEQGPRLQQLLVEYDDGLAAKHNPSGDYKWPEAGVSLEESKYGSYVEEFWNDAYLVPDDSVVLNVNPFFLLADDPTPARTEQCVRAASLVFSSLKFISALFMGQLEPDVWRGRPLCMAQFRKIFGTARIPHIDRDAIATAARPTHLCVLCRNNFYFFDCLWPSGEVGITEAQIETNLRAILADAAACASDPDASRPLPVGVLTTAARKSWAVHREHLAALSPNNRVVLDVVDTALFIVCLDEGGEVSGLDEACANALHGTYKLSEPTQSNGFAVQQVGSCCNRWYDKHQIVVDEAGTAGVNFEHSAVDGHTMLRFTSDVFADTIVRFAQSITATTHGKDYLQPLLAAKYKAPSADGGPQQMEPR